MKKVAITITYFKIFFICALCVLPTFSPIFLCIYSMCGLTTILKTLMNRTFEVKDEDGMKLDCYTDLIFTLIILVKILLELMEKMPQWCFVVIIVIGFFKTLSGLFAMAKFHVFEPLHTTLNGLTAVLLFLSPYMVVAFDVAISCQIVFAVAVLASFEELICMLTSKEYNPNRKSIFSK